jgi:hypothetical protein
MKMSRRSFLDVNLDHSLLDILGSFTILSVIRYNLIFKENFVDGRVNYYHVEIEFS